MDLEHRMKLRDHKVAIAEAINGAEFEIALELLQAGVFLENDLSLMRSSMSPGETLVGLLLQRGSRAYHSFLESLNRIGLKRVVDMLCKPDCQTGPSLSQKTETPEEPRPSDTIDIEDGILRTSQPQAIKSSQDTEDGKVSKSDKTKETIEEGVHCVDAPLPRSSISSSDYYPVVNKRRGLFMIFNNKDFLPSSGMHKYPRNGTDRDADRLEALFESLSFDVNRHNNATVSTMRKCLKEASSLNYSKYDCFACAILTHGEEGILYGTDGTVQTRDLTSMFQGPNLAGKPKLFFFQACQGSKYMDANNVDSADGIGDNSKEDLSIPMEADFLYAYSTVPGYYSWRNSTKGSWFVQGICEIFSKYATQGMDIIRMLTRVNDYVSREKSQTGENASNNKRQISTIVSMLRKEFYFCPPK